MAGRCAISHLNPSSAIRKTSSRSPGRRDAASAPISAISAGDNSKSKIAKFSVSRSTLLVRGMTTMPRCTRKRRQTCAAVLLWSLADAGEHLVVLRAAAGDRAVGDHRHPMRATGGNDFRLVEKRMHLDLVADDRLVGEAHRLVDQRDGEVRHANMARQARPLRPCRARRAYRRAGCSDWANAAAEDRPPTAGAWPRLSLAAFSRSRGAKFDGHTLVVTNTSPRFTPEARSPSPTSLSLPYISAVSTWR